MKTNLIDERIGTVMYHPMFGEILITDIRKAFDSTLAYYDNSFVNINVLTKLRENI